MTPTVAPPLLRRPHGGHNARLHRSEVDQIRRWARTEGFGLSPDDQARELRANPTYAALSALTLVELLTNQTWVDLSYDRDVPIVDRDAAHANPWLLIVFLQLLMLGWHARCTPRMETTVMEHRQ